MTNWQRYARLFVALFAVAFAVVVALAFRHRPPVAPAASVARTDPSAIIESTGGRVVRVTGTHEDVDIEYERQLTYANGSTKLFGVKIITDERGSGGRTFAVTGREGQVGENQSTIVLTGDVKLNASDGLTAESESATYAENEGMVRAPGAGRFARGRLTGSGVGLTYDKNRDVLTILQQTVVHMAPDAAGRGLVDVSSAAGTFARRDRYVQFEGGVTVRREGQVIEADAATARLSADGQQIEAMDLRGNSRISAASAAQGGLQRLTGRDINLKYAVEGQALEQVTIDGDAVITLAGDAGQPGAEIRANVVDVALAGDGSTPTALVGRDAVQVTFPTESVGTARTIRAATLDAKGQPGVGLTTAEFGGNVDFRENGRGVDRTARSGTLNLTLRGGMSSFEDATFAHAVRFEDGSTVAMSAVARYVLAKEVLELTGSETGVPRPHVVTDQIAVDATRIDVGLAGPKMKATGNVKSVLQPATKAAGTARGRETKTPSMLKQDQPVNVTGGEMDYDGLSSSASYTKGAQLWQGDTAIGAESLNIDDKTGDLAAAGSVRSAIMLEQIGKDTKTKERVRSLGTSSTFKYDEGARRATYAGEAHMSGSEGDMTADRIELYLKPAGDELERVEAYDTVTLRENARKTTGLRMTYYAADERYVVTGTPVTVLDQCGRETIGRTLTFFKAVDRIVVDGNEQIRTQTKGGNACK
jgi:LPS export ABC transporter protein LptC